jgi:ABC-type dipeptide/oligopeptide/nickel transport system permease subunit
MSLGIVLVLIVLAINILAQSLKSFAERRYG